MLWPMNINFWLAQVLEKIFIGEIFPNSYCIGVL